MKILTLSDNAWDNTNATGNTYSNFFSDWNNAEYANIFLREANPDNAICKNYYRITDKMLLKNIFTPSKIGQAFTTNDKKTSQGKSANNEKKMISLIHRYNIRVIYSFERMLWKLKGWQNRKLEEFINGLNPDIVFSFARTSLQNYLLLKYLKKNTKAKIVLFIADNVYGKYFTQNGRKRPEAKRFREMIMMSDKIYGISEEICHVYGKEFGVTVTPLYKGCKFKGCAKNTVGSPVSITYAGNLLYGRLNTLVKLAEEIQKINSEDQKCFLKIYSGTLITDAEKEKLSIPGSSEFCGLRKYDEIKTILEESDIVLHIESFDPNQIETVKYSFSTKIIDCLQSGSTLMVIGPKGISSVEYPKKIPGAIVIDNVNNIGCTLQDILNDVCNLTKRAAAIRLFAEENHSLESVHRRLQSDFAIITE